MGRPGRPRGTYGPHRPKTERLAEREAVMREAQAKIQRPAKQVLRDYPRLLRRRRNMTRPNWIKALEQRVMAAAAGCSSIEDLRVKVEEFENRAKRAQSEARS